MSFLTAKQLLVRAAREYQHDKMSFSKEEIVSKINEIKYLSAQKKIPKLTLRKEIIHLENTLEDVFGLQQRILERKTQESTNITVLKKQLAVLKRRLAASGDHDLHKKVQKLSHVLGDYMAQKEVRTEVHNGDMPESRNRLKTALPSSSSIDSIRIQALQGKLALLKQAIQKYPGTGKDQGLLKEKIMAIEEKLQRYAGKDEPEVMEASGGVQPGTIKHTILFDMKPEMKSSMVVTDNVDMEKELPLPPPPKMRKGVES